MKQIEHIGIAVNNLENSIPLFEKLLKTNCYKTEIVESEQVATAFFACGESKFELLQSLEADGIIKKFIDKRGEGMHHIAFLVDDIYAEINRLKAEGFAFINDDPKIGADNKLICFLHPKETNGVLIELCQEIDRNAD
jgi:methylmalonyl-CoA/ethylmalonyl-CoA epimerase